MPMNRTVAGPGIGELTYRGAPVGTVHSAPQHQRVVSAGGQQRREDPPHGMQSADGLAPLAKRRGNATASEATANGRWIVRPRPEPIADNQTCLWPADFTPAN